MVGGSKGGAKGVAGGDSKRVPRGGRGLAKGVHGRSDYTQARLSMVTSSDNPLHQPLHIFCVRPLLSPCNPSTNPQPPPPPNPR